MPSYTSTSFPADQNKDQNKDQSTDQNLAPDAETVETVKVDKTLDARQRILSVALTEFSSRGYDGVSTTQIARASGVTQPLIHYHFKSKYSLWKAAVKQAFTWFDEEYLAVIQAKSCDDQREYIEFAITTFVEFAAVRPELARFLLNEGSQESERLDWMVENFVKPIIQNFEVIYASGVESGNLRDMPLPQLVSISLGAATQFYAWRPMLERTWGVNPEDEKQNQIQLSAVTDFIKNAIMV